MHRATQALLFAAGVVVGVALAVPFYIERVTTAHISTSAGEAPTSTVAIVLGASVVRGEPSPVLQKRAELALQLYRADKVQKILVTGDDSVPGFDEVTPVARFLEGEGVMAEDIFLDHAGFDTYSSMYRAREVFGVTDALVVSQAFHLPRAVFLARELGLAAKGVPAEGGASELYNHIREVPASVKAVLDVLRKREPTTLGERYPIGGDGRETW